MLFMCDQVRRGASDNHKDLLKANTSPGADSGTIAGGGLSSLVNRRRRRC